MEERRFLDLDHVSDKIPDENDREMFGEAIRCYQIGSHRAAVILAWCVTADCLSRRIDELAAENDGVAQTARASLLQVENTARYEEVLITQARLCDLVDDYDEKCLRFTRDTRSKCAHPTGVIPSAEAVRHILHICSQTVLSRNGFRSISFVKEFVSTKLKDRHLFSNRPRIEADCRYFLEKVPERVRVQFGAEIAKNYNGSDPVWLNNVLIFLRHLFVSSNPRFLSDVARKLQRIESQDRHVFSVIVGLTNQEGVWEIQEVNQSKAHLREALSSGRVDPVVFRSFGNLCALSSIEENDEVLLKNRFSLLIDHMSSHRLLQEICGATITSIVIDALDEEENIQEQIRKGLAEFSSLEFAFTEESSEKNKLFINVLIQADWRDQNIASTWQQVSSWAPPLLAALLSLSSDYLSECSEDYPDDVLVLFEAVTTLAQRAPGLIDGTFEQSIMDVLEARLEPTWYSEFGVAYQNFIGQIKLLQERYTALFSRIYAFELPQATEQSGEEIDE